MKMKWIDPKTKLESKPVKYREYTFVVYGLGADRYYARIGNPWKTVVYVTQTLSLDAAIADAKSFINVALAV